MLTKAIVFTSVLAVASAIATAPLVRAAGQDAALVQKGEQLYGAQKCMICHAIAGKGNKANPLDKVGAKLSAADIREWIVNPVEMAKKSKSTGKPPMPAKYKGLAPAEIDALVAYMQSLK
jgi:mono/diheme cytochrome c family protein